MYLVTGQKSHVGTMKLDTNMAADPEQLAADPQTIMLPAARDLSGTFFFFFFLNGYLTRFLELSIPILALVLLG